MYVGKQASERFDLVNVVWDNTESAEVFSTEIRESLMSLIHVGNGVYNQLGDGLILKGLCKPCTEGVYRPLPLLVAMAQNARRAEEWSKCILSDNSNGFPATSLYERTHPLYGAYGEKI